MYIYRESDERTREGKDYKGDPPFVAWADQVTVSQAWSKWVSLAAAWSLILATGLSSMASCPSMKLWCPQREMQGRLGGL